MGPAAHSPAGKSIRVSTNLPEDSGGLTTSLQGTYVTSCSPKSFLGMSAEQLLILCATAVENKNEITAQQAVYALKSMSSVDGEPRERVTHYFLQALVRRAGKLLDPSLTFKFDHPTSHEVEWTESRKLSLNKLTSFVDLTPYYRFGYTAANGALLDAFEGSERVHILDFSTTHCMQWPTLIEALADRIEGPPLVRLTVSSATVPTAPRLETTYEELGSRLKAFAEWKRVPFVFHILPCPLESLEASDIGLRAGETLGVNCGLRLHYIPDETAGSLVKHESQLFTGAAAYPVGEPYAKESLCPRDRFLQLIRGLNPTIVTLYEEDCDTTSTNVVSRLKESYDHEWIPFDFSGTSWHPGNEDRLEFEKDVGRKIENIVACEGVHRIERLESKIHWFMRLQRLQFYRVPLSDDVIVALKDVLDDHASGWGMRLDEDDTQSLTWKGHSVAFASAWFPIPSSRSQTN